MLLMMMMMIYSVMWHSQLHYHNAAVPETFLRRGVALRCFPSMLASSTYFHYNINKPLKFAETPLFLYCYQLPIAIVIRYKEPMYRPVMERVGTSDAAALCKIHQDMHTAFLCNTFEQLEKLTALRATLTQ